MNIPSRRLVNLAGFAICAGLMGFALYAQHGLGLEPCPLCVFQRVGMIALGTIFLVAGVHDPGVSGARAYGLLAALAAAGGGAVAGRHMWLQGLPPDEVPACGPGLQYMLDSFPLSEVLAEVFSGSGECAQISWSFLGLSMPTWVLLWFIALGTGALLNGFRRA